ncbi:hypothetical protein ABL78_3584 [Leptomonas seymouri]|uniref:Uncharacterized protein n=1 Tax=Leptomonas seymouri TaxID=5684 RepID=A0A0N1I7K5_LEPSE|nr:hypothetical protein ABL78_3584 [Leptomonas seymouri]|eukprot:KPI87343.1 hypothetical protein ABL78_3584 [Leptomonas seymouri]
MASVCVDVTQGWQQPQLLPSDGQSTLTMRKLEVDHDAFDEVSGIVWFGLVPVDRFFEMTSYFLSLEGIRREESANRARFDISFFVDGPYAGEGFIRLNTLEDAQALVSRFPRSIMVGQAPRFPIQLQLSSMQDLQLALQSYEGKYEEGPASTPTPPAAAEGEDCSTSSKNEEDESGREKTSIYWLRGFPFETTTADLEAYLKPIEGKYRHLHIGCLSTGECSGNVFVELKSAADRKAVMQLHNKFIPIAAHAALPPRQRPKPRFVEVIAANAQRRADQLEQDGRTKRSLPGQQQKFSQHGTKAATAPASDGATAAAASAAVAATPAKPIHANRPSSIRGTSFAQAARTQTSPMLSSPKQQHHQHRQQQQPAICTYTSRSFTPQQFDTVTLYSQAPPSSLPAAFQQSQQQQQQQQQQQLPVMLQSTQQIAYLPQQPQHEVPQQLQPNRYYLFQGSATPAPPLLVNSTSFPSYSMAMHTNSASTISVFSVNPSPGCFNDRAQPSMPVAQQTFAPAPFSLLPPVQQQPQSFFIASSDQKAFDLQRAPNYFFVSSS